MEDLRRKHNLNKHKQNILFINIKAFFIKHWTKVLIWSIIAIIIIFPTFVGTVVGHWFNELITSFLKNITF